MKTVNERPLLDPSPRTPYPPPHTHPAASELPGPLSEPPLRTADDGSAHTSNNPFLVTSTSHRRNPSSGRSRGSRDDAAFPHVTLSALLRSGSSSNGANRHPTAVRYGSRAESDRYGSSLKEIPDAEARLVFVSDPDRTAETAPSSSSPGAAIFGNSIRTSKYSVLTFLPRNLFEQFHRVAYIYFLIIAVLNQLPMLAVFGRGASIMPLAFVLLVTAAKDGYEDFRRHRSDRMENNREAMVLTWPDGGGGGGGASFQPKRWRDVRVGEVIQVRSNETLPCDMVLLATSDPTGVAYVQTINLDGESNLKTRYAKQETQARWKAIIENNDNNHNSNSNLFPPPALIRCERPNRNIYGFLANIEIEGKKASLGPSNIILRGCELKNTSWAVGVSVYTGRDTKVMLNSSGAPSKRSRLETHMNRETISLSVILVLMCTVVAALHGVWTATHKDELDYSPFFRKKQFYGGEASNNFIKNYNYYGIAAEVVFAFLMSVIVFQIMIPISLYISMELVRLGQAYFMIRDQDLYDDSSNSRFQCRALNINEDLGQIKYVFSDKTGTLTENKMVFQNASIAGVDYHGGGGEEEAAVAAEYCVFGADGKTVLKPRMMVRTDPELVQCLRRIKQNDERAKQANDFLLALAACNTIVPLLVDTDKEDVKLIDYQGESPDEQALVYAAASYGYVLVERTSGHIVVDVLGNRQRYNVLGLHEFDSDRKRMSVIVGCPDGTTKLFVKGADSSMLGVLDKTQSPNVITSTESDLKAYSSLGLRTLVIGMKDLRNSDFQSWQSAYETASTALLGRGRLLRNVAANVECNLHILGATGIEDKLQQGVPEAIESLRIAGMKVWVLTGDKQETAISIGYSCKLLTQEMRQIVINGNSPDSCGRKLKDAIESIRGLAGASKVPLALIIDGTSLVYILEKELEEELFKLATACDVVLCCRVAPLQKAGIVALIKNRTEDMTLAIGDGANDVSMIQMADVGIGISGQEGRQAVMASDFAMGQFRFLVPLLLVHGHWNYQRMAYMILYNFYRNSVFVFQLFWFVLYTAFTLTVAISEWSSVLYSIIYTALPTIIVGILDKDLGRKTLLRNPQLYGAGQREESYNVKLFVVTMLDSLWQSAVIFFVPYFIYRNSNVDIFSFGDVLVLAVVLLVNIHLAMDVFRWYWVTHVAIWGCIVATLICVIILDSIPDLPGYWAVFHILGTRQFWACLFGILVMGMVPRFVVKVMGQHFWPCDIQIAREMEKLSRLRESTAEVEMSAPTKDRRTISR